VLSIIFVVGILYSFREYNDLKSSIVAIIILLLGLFITNDGGMDNLSFLTARCRLNHKINKILKGYGVYLLPEVELKNVLKKYFKKRTMDKDFIDSASEAECAALMFSLQNEKIPFNISDDLSLPEFRKIAQYAARNVDYRRLLLSNSLIGINYDKTKVIDKFADIQYDIGDDLKRLADKNFIRRIPSTTLDEMIVFSTTSQMSSDILNIITGHRENIQKVSFFICSPFMKSDTAIESTFSEYKNPKFTTPYLQFIQNDDDSINEKVDAIRRVFKILSCIVSLVEINEKKNSYIEINIFKKKYPGVKIKLLKNEKYLQIQPGNLSYANNLYRFGVELDSSDSFNDVFDAIEKYRASPDLVEVLSLNSSNLNSFKNSVLSELSLWLLENGILPEMIMKNKQKIITITGNENTSKWLDHIIKAISKARLM